MFKVTLCSLGVALTMQASLISNAQPTAKQSPNYSLAARFSPDRLQKTVFSTVVSPNWLKKTNRFWYLYQTTQEKKWIIVELDKGIKKPLFDHQKMAAEISLLSKEGYDAQHLNLENLKFSEDETSLLFELTTRIEEKDKKEKKVLSFSYSFESEKLILINKEKEKPLPAWAASFSPNKKFIVYAKYHNLYTMDSANLVKAIKNETDSSIVETKLTDDGERYFSYQASDPVETDEEKEKNRHKRRPVFIAWSPDGNHFYSIRTDNRKVKDLWVLHSTTNPRPQLHTYKYVMAGDTTQYEEEVYVYDFINKTKKIITTNQYKNQNLNMYLKTMNNQEQANKYRTRFWVGTNDRFYFQRLSRDYKKLDVCAVDFKKSHLAIPLIKEEINTYLEQIDFAVINEGKDLIQWSEREGWAHFYLYDQNGTLKNKITSGSFHCSNIVHIDEKNRVLYFIAEGTNSAIDPFYSHLCKVNLDGTGFKVLNNGNFTSIVNISDDGKFFVSNNSRVDMAPESLLFDQTGKKMLQLETADLSELFATGYKFPEPIKVKAADGYTDLFGVLYKPFDFDSTKKYPLIMYVYPGPQADPVNRFFSGRFMDKVDRLAQLGFICIAVGNRGGHPNRSKWYHDFGYGDMRDYGIPDIKAVAEKASYKYPFIDINKVGIQGHSGGGFMSTAAMLTYPDFFKVAVSSSGNHENNIYNRWWSEKFHGIKEVINDKKDTSFVYSIEKNLDLVKNLKGNLLITTGEVDENVHPAATIRLANALIKANKRFDFMIMPGQRHGYASMNEYFFWMMADYFSKHLLHDYQPKPIDIIEIQNDIEKN